MALAICKRCGHEQGYQAQGGPKLRTLKCEACGKPALRRALHPDLAARFERSQGPVRRAREAQRRLDIDARAGVDAEHRAPVLCVAQVKAPKRHALTEQVLEGAVDVALDELSGKGRKPALKLGAERSLELLAERVDAEKTSATALLALAHSAKKHLRRLASAASAQAEVSRAIVDRLGEINGQLQKLYAGMDCMAAVLIDLRDRLKPALREAARGGTPPPVEDGPADAAKDVIVKRSDGAYMRYLGDVQGGDIVVYAFCMCDGKRATDTTFTCPAADWHKWCRAGTYVHVEADPGRSFKDMRHSPIVGDAMRMPTGDIIKIIGRNASDISVRITPAEDGPTREMQVSLASWQTLFDEAALQRPFNPEPDAPALDSHVRRQMAENPTPGDVLIEHDGERFKVASITTLEDGAFRVHYDGPAGEGWANKEAWARKIAKAQSVLPVNVSGDTEMKLAEREGGADA